jgi:hypothetical protein
MREATCGERSPQEAENGPFLGGVAEWLGSGLQSRVQRFNSAPRLLYDSPAGA